MSMYWSETVDDELNALGLIAWTVPYILGLDVQSDRQQAVFVLAADAPDDVRLQVDAAIREHGSDRLNVAVRTSRHTLRQLQAADQHVSGGSWTGGQPGGPMSVGYSPALDLIEVHFPSEFSAAAERLRADLPGLVHVVLDDGMMPRP
jgi:hypothetical protein